jgi:HlyD family secretion protein
MHYPTAAHFVRALLRFFNGSSIMRKYFIPMLILFLLGGGAIFYFVRQSSAKGDSFRTEDVKRDELVVTVSATGTLEPEDVVDVGAQVAGMIVKLGPRNGKDVDYGSAVEEGDTLALIDDRLFAAKVEQSKAMVESSQTKVESAVAKLEQAKAQAKQTHANTQVAVANVDKAKALAVQSSRDLDRAKKLFTGSSTSSISQADVDAAQAAYDTNNAAVAVAAATVDQSKAAEIGADAAVKDADAAVQDAKATVKLNQAMLKQDQINLDYCTIKSTVKGTIIDRRVGVGQTVQSSFNTPSLFLIAKDLTHMKVWASVNEADISQIHKDQPVTFTVDAYPGHTFKGTVALIRLNATNTSNVVTYTVEVTAPNTDEKFKLLPYMTANLKFEVSRKQDVLLVSNAALRFRPPADKIAPDAKNSSGKAPTAGQPKAKTGPKTSDHGSVWVEENGLLKPIRIKIGQSDGTMTEVLGGDLKEGTKVVSGEAHPTATDDSATNPFATNVGKGSKKQQ